MIFKNTQNWGWLHISWGWKSRNWLGKFIAGFEAGAWRVTLSFVPFCFIHLAYRLKLLHMGSSKRDFCCHLCFPEGQLIIFALEMMNIRWEHCMISYVGWSNMDFKWRNLKQFFFCRVWVCHWSMLNCMLNSPPLPHPKENMTGMSTWALCMPYGCHSSNGVEKTK